VDIVSSNLKVSKIRPDHVRHGADTYCSVRPGYVRIGKVIMKDELIEIFNDQIKICKKRCKKKT
jgi:hypothetical protein